MAMFLFPGKRHLHALLILGLCLCIPHNGHAKGLVLEENMDSVQYLLSYSGLVGNDHITIARGLLTVMHPNPGDTNPYLIIIKGYPYTNSRNSFFWISPKTPMTAMGTDIRCRVVRSYVNQSQNLFYYMSPTLLKRKGMRTHSYGSNRKEDLAKALPTEIVANAGELKLRISGNKVTGTVWMTGYDPIEKAHIKYTVNITGQKTYKMEVPTKTN